MKAVLVGGPHDGKSMEVQDHLSRTGLTMPPMPDQAPGQFHEYRCEWLGIRGTVRGERSPCLFVHSGLTIAEAVGKVLDAYVRQGA